MAIGANGSNKVVRRYSRSARVVTDVQGSYTPASKASAEMFETVKGGFDQAVKFMRPAVTQEQTIKGEKEANEAFENGTFEMRSPFTIRDQAFNKSGELLVTNRAMIELDEGFRAAMAKANGNMRVLDAELQELEGKRGDYPEIPGLQTNWAESYERGAVTARRQTTELAQRRAVAAARQAAADAAASAASETERLAFSAGSVDEVSAAITSGVDRLAQFGPRGEFEVNGKAYPADPTRQGTLSPRQIQNQADALSNSAHELFLRADLARSDNPGEWGRQLNEQVMSGNSPLPPSQALSLLNTLEGQSRARQNAINAQEAAIEREIAQSVDAGFAPYVTAMDGGVFEAVPEDTRIALREQAAGNPAILADLNNRFAAADAIVELAQLAPQARAERISELQAGFAATPGVNAQEAAVINAIQPFVTATRKALAEQTETMITGGEALLRGGGLVSEDGFAEMRASAAGNPELLEDIDALAVAQSYISEASSLSGDELEEMQNSMESLLFDLQTKGAAAGSDAALRLQGLELAMDHFATLEELAVNNPAEFARKSGIALEPFPQDPEAGMNEIVGTIAARVNQVADRTGQYGNDTPVPLGASEKAMLADFMREARPSQRVGMVEQLYQQLPRDQADAVLDSLGSATPELRAAGRIYDSNPGAVSVMMAGVGVTIQGDTPTNRAEVEADALAPFVGQLSVEGRTRLMDDAMAYARGMAAQSGATEVQIADIEAGLDIAMGADENGDGGIERVRHYGTAILPSGIRGRDLGTNFRAMDDATALEIFGGSVMDAQGRPYTADQLTDTVEGFVPDPTDPDRLIPVDAAGRAFMVNNGLASFSVRDLIGG